MTSQTSPLENDSSSASKTLRQLRDFVKNHRNIILLILSIVLIVLAAFLINLLVTHTFEPYFKCAFLIDSTLKTTLCSGFRIGPFEIKPPWWLTWLFKPFDIGPFPKPPKSILPPLGDFIDNPLEAIRKFVVWNIIFAFAVVSLVLAFIASKMMGFVRLLLTPEGRKAILTNLNLWLLIFAIFCTLFYFGVVVPH